MALLSEGEALAGLLHGGTCPVGHNCQAPDCIECLEKYAEKEAQHECKVNAARKTGGQVFP